VTQAPRARVLPWCGGPSICSECARREALEKVTRDGMAVVEAGRELDVAHAAFLIAVDSGFRPTSAVDYEVPPVSWVLRMGIPNLVRVWYEPIEDEE
jgi:hypothetical protein